MLKYWKESESITSEVVHQGPSPGSPSGSSMHKAMTKYKFKSSQITLIPEKNFFGPNSKEPAHFLKIHWLFTAIVARPQLVFKPPPLSFLHMGFDTRTRIPKPTFHWRLIFEAFLLSNSWLDDINSLTKWFWEQGLRAIDAARQAFLWSFRGTHLGASIFNSQQKKTCTQTSSYLKPDVSSQAHMGREICLFSLFFFK